MSPELRKAYINSEDLNETNYDVYKSDIYALGMTLVDIATMTIGENKPIKDKLEVIKKRYGDSFFQFISYMLEEDFNQRRNIFQLKEFFEKNLDFQVKIMVLLKKSNIFTKRRKIQ